MIAPRPQRRVHAGSVGVRSLAVFLAGAVVACSSATNEDSPLPPGQGSIASSWAGDCPDDDGAGNLAKQAVTGQLFDAQLSWRQSGDQPGPLSAACDFSKHAVTAGGLLNAPLACTGKSQAQSHYMRVAARWGTSAGTPACSQDYCAAIYVRDSRGGIREAVRDIYLKDRFACSQKSDRTDERLDIDACTYADVVGALKQGDHAAPGDEANLTFDNGHLTGYAGRGLQLRYKMYPCASGPGGGASGAQVANGEGGATCGDRPTPDGFTCAQQYAWGKCNQSWMTAGRFCRQTCGHCPGGPVCDDLPTPDGFGCAQQLSWSKCEEPWMTKGGFCRATCGHC